MQRSAPFARGRPFRVDQVGRIRQPAGTMDFNELQTDESKALEGIWVEYGDARFRIRHTNTKEYRKAVTKAGRGKAPQKLRKDVELQTKFGIAVLATAVLLDWENVTDDGIELEPTTENKVKLLTLAEDLRNFLAEEAGDAGNFQQEGEKADSADLKSAD